MRRARLVLLTLTLAGCAWFREPPEQKIAPGSRVIYHGGGFAVWSICDRGNLIYMTEKAPTVAVVAGGCTADQIVTPGPPGAEPKEAPPPINLYMQPAPTPECPTCPACPPPPASKAAPKKGARPC